MKIKRILVVMLVAMFAFSSMITTVSAASEAIPRSSYFDSCVPTFTISNGVATVKLRYSVRNVDFTSVTLTVSIQRKLWNLFWVAYDIGVPNNVWSETKTEKTGTFTNTFSIEDTGNYRCNFTVTLEGVGAESDVVETSLTYSYN